MWLFTKMKKMSKGRETWHNAKFINKDEKDVKRWKRWNLFENLLPAESANPPSFVSCYLCELSVVNRSNLWQNLYSASSCFLSNSVATFGLALPPSHPKRARPSSRYSIKMKKITLIHTKFYQILNFSIYNYYEN